MKCPIDPGHSTNIGKASGEWQCKECQHFIWELVANKQMIDDNRPTLDLSKPTYEERGASIGRMLDLKNKQYGNSVATTGEWLRLIFPAGIDPVVYHRVHLLIRIQDKLARLAQPGVDPEDVWSDLIGYCMLGKSLEEGRQ